MQANRRQLLCQIGHAFAWFAFLLPGRGFAQKKKICRTTPRQTAGPYYPRAPKWKGNDLTSPSKKKSIGSIIIIEGTVSQGPACTEARAALIELWQADTNGKYNHPDDPRKLDIDAQFAYRGRTKTDAKGRYSFKTILPGAYPGRTPHIHFRFQAANGAELVTQLYFAQAETQNAKDGIYRNLMRKKVTDLVTTKLKAGADGVLTGTFDVNLPLT